LMTDSSSTMFSTAMDYDNAFYLAIKLLPMFFFGLPDFFHFAWLFVHDKLGNKFSIQDNINRDLVY
jgi:hypothetical protein